MQPRFTLRLDEDRKNAGWGEHYWLIDSLDQVKMRLLPKDRAEREVKELNAQYESIPIR